MSARIVAAVACITAAVLVGIVIGRRASSDIARVELSDLTDNTRDDLGFRRYVDGSLVVFKDPAEEAQR